MAILDKSKYNWVVDQDEDQFIGITIPFILGSGEEASTKTTLEAVKMNVLNLCSTEEGERIMQPDFGTKLWEYLFEHINDDLKKVKIKNELKRATGLWMPMVQIDEVLFPKDPNEHKVYVKVFYSIPNYNLHDELQLEVQ